MSSNLLSIHEMIQSKLNLINYSYISTKSGPKLSPVEMENALSLMLGEFEDFPRMMIKASPEYLVKQLRNINERCGKVCKKIGASRESIDGTKEILEMGISTIESFSNSGEYDAVSVFDLIDSVITSTAIQVHDSQLSKRYVEVESVLKQAVDKVHGSQENPLNSSQKDYMYRRLLTTFFYNESEKIQVNGPAEGIKESLKLFGDCCAKIYDEFGITAGSNDFSFKERMGEGNYIPSETDLRNKIQGMSELLVTRVYQISKVKQ
jgi:hypothetical protein